MSDVTLFPAVSGYGYLNIQSWYRSHPHVYFLVFIEIQTRASAHTHTITLQKAAPLKRSEYLIKQMEEYLSLIHILKREKKSSLNFA